MASFISHNGQWFAAKEQFSSVYKGEAPVAYDKLGKWVKPMDDTKDVLEKGDHYFYNGPDREAMYMLKEAGEENLGVHFMDSNEFHEFINQKQGGNADAYLKRIGYDPKKAKDNFEKMFSRVNRHELPERGEENLLLAGSTELVGGFGDQKLRTIEEAKVEKSSLKNIKKEKVGV